MKVGDSIYCIKTNIISGVSSNIQVNTKGNFYFIHKVKNDNYVLITTDHDNTSCEYILYDKNSDRNFYNFFITLRKLRKEKLKKINEINESR